MSKYALIIGGSSGIGLATAKKLINEGFGVFIVHRDRRSTLAPFENEITALKKISSDIFTFNIDGTNREKIQTACEAFQATMKGVKFTLMLHALSRGNLKSIVSENNPELTEEDISLTMEAMSINIVSWTKALIKNQLFTDHGRIVTLTSAGSEKYWSGYGAVAMAKASLEILTKYLAVELASYNIRANVINAGITDTPSLKLIPDYDKLVEEAKARNPLGRMTQPEDVANVVYLLTTPEANWINGTVINVDGGESLI